MADEQLPFADVREEEGGAISIPELKWRELVFVGVLRAAPDGRGWERDPARPMPPFRAGDPFPEGVRFVPERRGRRVLVRRI
jgi:hypothetical protein